MQGAAVYNGMMAYGHIIADGGSVFLVSAVDTGPVLHIYFVPDADKIHIATHNGVKPETAIVTGNHIAHNGGIGGNEIVVAKLGEFFFYGKYDGHWYFLFLPQRTGGERGFAAILIKHCAAPVFSASRP
jgi:hypothetical protein